MSIQIISSSKPSSDKIATGRVGFTSIRTEKAATRTAALFESKKTTLGDTRTKLLEMQDLYSLIDKHGYLRAAIALIGRSAVGAWWTLVRDKEASKPRQLHRKNLMRFYSEPAGTWTNINDYYSMAYKIVIGAMYLKLFGQVGFHLVRNENDDAVSMDHIPAFLVPQVDERGNFLTPAFKAYPVNGKGSPVEYSSPRDIVYIVNPDFGGSPMGASDLIALSDYTFPIDIYLQTLARSYLQNNTRPELIYQVPESISEENFIDFVEEVTARWRGPQNAGRTPIVVQGDFKVHKLGDLPDALPYAESRNNARDEEFAVTGVSGPKVGLFDGISASGMKEARREFHESVMEPLFTVIEEAFYWQINVREFGYRDWRFRFNSPDFLTELERATVNMRYYQSNAITPNEMRDSRDMEPRGDEAGDMFLDQLNTQVEEIEPEEPQGSPPEGRDDKDDEDTDPLDDHEGDPERGDDHDQRVRDFIKEVRAWKRFALARYNLANPRKFNPEHIDIQSAMVIQQELDNAETIEDIAYIFEQVLDVVGEHYE